MGLLRGPDTEWKSTLKLVRELTDPCQLLVTVLCSGFLRVSFLGDHCDLWQPGLSLWLSLSCDPVPKAGSCSSVE